jgi:hypothetical protein
MWRNLNFQQRLEETMTIRIPENNKKPGICYAITDDGIELPVIDITHPAFAFEMNDAELNTLIDQFVLSLQRMATLPAAAVKSMAQNSILYRGIAESAGTYTSGIMTYLNKLGPTNLGDGYAGAMDRQWAASLTPVTFRWRMRDVARLLADRISMTLPVRSSAPLHLINIGGGPAADSLNALLLVQKEHPGWLVGHQVCIHVLDLDQEGPCFGARALQALLAEGAPLHDLAITFEYIPYNWADPTGLRRVTGTFDAGSITLGSTEGGLFEFASDEEIKANLMALHEAAPDDFIMVGPVVRDAATLDPRLKITEHVPGRPAIRYIGLENFQKLVGSTGWTIKDRLDGPMHQVISLGKK